MITDIKIVARHKDHREKWVECAFIAMSVDDAKQQIDNASALLKANFEFAIKQTTIEIYPKQTEA